MEQFRLKGSGENLREESEMYKNENNHQIHQDYDENTSNKKFTIDRETVNGIVKGIFKLRDVSNNTKTKMKTIWIMQEMEDGDTLEREFDIEPSIVEKLVGTEYYNDVLVTFEVEDSIENVKMYNKYKGKYENKSNQIINLKVLDVATNVDMSAYNYDKDMIFESNYIFKTYSFKSADTIEKIRKDHYVVKYDEYTRVNGQIKPTKAKSVKIYDENKELIQKLHTIRCGTEVNMKLKVHLADDIFLELLDIEILDGNLSNKRRE